MVLRMHVHSEHASKNHASVRRQPDPPREGPAGGSAPAQWTATILHPEGASSSAAAAVYARTPGGPDGSRQQRPRLRLEQHRRVLDRPQSARGLRLGCHGPLPPHADVGKHLTRQPLDGSPDHGSTSHPPPARIGRSPTLSRTTGRSAASTSMARNAPPSGPTRRTHGKTSPRPVCWPRSSGRMCSARSMCAEPSPSWAAGRELLPLRSLM